MRYQVCLAGLAGRSQPLAGDLSRWAWTGLAGRSQPLAGDLSCGAWTGLAGRSQPLAGDLSCGAAGLGGLAARSHPLAGDLRRGVAVPAGLAGRSQPLPGDLPGRVCGVRSAEAPPSAFPRPFPAKFSLTVRPPGSAAAEDAACGRASDEERPPASRSFGSGRAGGGTWNPELPASRSPGAAPAVATRNAGASRGAWLKSGRGARSGAGPRSATDVSHSTNGQSSRSYRIAAGSTCWTTGPVTPGSLSIMPSAALPASPIATPTAITVSEVTVVCSPPVSLIALRIRPQA